MIKSETLLVCGIMLERYLNVLTEHPHATTPQFRAMVAAAAADVKRARDEEMMAIRRAVQAVPTETDQASLLSVLATG
ncbi:MAG: hypothetical protein ABTR07_15285 [Candidatus Competibacter denitrificans]